MIVLPRKTPERLAFYEVMMRRGQEHTEYAKLYAQAKSGYLGERRLDREWKDANVNGLLFHDFTCFNSADHPHQMDTVFLCKHFVLVVEVKNVAGRIDFNTQTRQLVRRREDGVVEAFNSPIDQVKRHQLLLESHFMTLPDYVPVEAAVIITNPSCLIGNTGAEIPMFVVTGLRSKLDEMMKHHKHMNLNTRLIRASLEKLYRPHTNQSWRKAGPIRTGVLCLVCNGKMIPSKRGFKCLHCNMTDSNHNAVRRTLYDYRILFGPEISNQKFRKFTEVTSRDTAYGILSRLLPEQKGTRRHSIYLIPENIYQPYN